MHKLLAAIVASTFALSAVSAFAAEAGKREELTQDQRADMRARADQLTSARAGGTEQMNTRVKSAPAPMKFHHTTKKTTKVTRHKVKKAHAKS